MRSIADVLDQVIVLVPANFPAREEIKEEFEGIKKSAELCSTEALPLLWVEAGETLHHYVGVPTGAAWKIKIYKVFAGE